MTPRFLALYAVVIGIAVCWGWCVAKVVHGGEQVIRAAGSKKQRIYIARRQPLSQEMLDRVMAKGRDDI